MPNSNTVNKGIQRQQKLILKSSIVNLHSGSKQIKKHKAIIRPDEGLSPAFSDASDKRYKTYTKSQKVSIVADLRKALWPRGSHNKSSPNNLLNHLESISKVQYNQVIESILSSHVPSSLKYKGNKKLWQKELKQWRRQLKSWVKNIDKPETRGNTRVIPQAKATEFKQRIIDILQGMSSRSFDLLRENALGALREMHKNGNSDEEDPRCVVNESTFSKHFWYDYMRANPDIEELYTALPICRNTAKKSVFKEEEVVPRAKEDKTDNAVSMFDTKTQESESPLLDDNFEEYCKYFAEEGLFNEDTCFSATQTTVAPGVFEQEKEEVSQSLMFSDVEQTCEAAKPVIDFYKCNKMIVETEDNEVQRSYFKQWQFCLNGLEL